MTEESRRAAFAREAGARLKPLLEESALKFPPELSGGRPNHWVCSSDRSLTVSIEGSIARALAVGTEWTPEGVNKGGTAGR